MPCLESKRTLQKKLESSIVDVKPEYNYDDCFEDEGKRVKV